MSLVGAAALLAGGPASAQVPAASANYSGYSTGAVVHTNVLGTPGPTTLAEIDQAYAGAAVNSQGFGSQIDSKIDTQVQAADASKKSGARGSGVELGIGVTNPVATAQALLAQKAVATAPPNSGLIDNKINLALDPVLNASLAEGRAQANWATDPSGANGCVLAGDISNGFGHLVNATAVGSPAPSALVNAPGELSSESHTKLVAQTNAAGAVIGNAVGLMSETTQRYVPIGLLGGALTATVVGPIHLRAVATGLPGQAYMQYGAPDGTPNSLPIVTLSTPAGQLAQITAGQLLGGNGINIPLGLINISIGTPAYALGGAVGSTPVAAADGTSVSGQADLIRITSPGVADIAVGHMEAAATAPAGGIICQIDVSKEAQPAQVNPGDTFNYLIHVHNPFTCPLTDVKVTDAIGASAGVRYEILGEDPKADSVSPSSIVWNNIGTIQPGETRTLTVNMKVLSSSAGGVFTEKATVTGNCAIGGAQGQTGIAVPAVGSASITAPSINGGAGRALPVTGGLTGRYYAIALLLGLSALAFGRRGFKALMGSKG